ncbi:hypothetical protein VTO42DRAFT_2909 [Malbranchea cinnamomea]
MPPQVISLLSSPENTSPQPRRQPPNCPVQKTAQNSNLVSLSDDHINSSLFDYGDIKTPAAKRRRLSPTPEPRKEETFTKTKHSPALCLSEDSILSDAQPVAQGRYDPSKQKHVCVDIFDPIVWSSSAPEPPLRTMNRQLSESGENGKGSEVISIDDDGIENMRAQFFVEDEEEPLGLSPPQTASHLNLSSRTAAVLASLKSQNNSKPSRTAGRANKGKRDTCVILSDDEVDVDDLLPSPGKKKRTTRAPTADRMAKALEREAAKARRQQEKEEEKERKRKLKEEKERQKRLAADIAEVNKSKVDKKISTPEMLIDVSLSLQDTSVGNQVGEHMRHIGVEMNFVPTQQPGVISWRRKVTARYNEKAGHWEPCPLTIEREEHVMCYLSAQEFVDLAVASGGDGTVGIGLLEEHVSKLMGSFPKAKPIYLIEGLLSWMRKNKNIRNRAYQAAVLRQFNEDLNNPETRQRRRKLDAPPPVDEDTIEDALLQLQVQHNCLIHHTNAPTESAEWIKNFTEHISTIPYRQERMNLQNASFCMDVGQVKTGEDARDTYVKMIQEVQRVTAPMAYGITTQYGNVRELIVAMKREGPLMLQDVKKCTNKSGALSEARIGPAVSRRLYKVFTGLDPTSTDV